MNTDEKSVLNLLQFGLPLCEDPYGVLGEKLGMNAKEVLATIRRLSDQGLIRRFGGIVDINQLDIASTLVGLKVKPNQVGSVAKTLNRYQGITHNYERSDNFNLWFTLMSSNQTTLKQTLEEISKLPGVISMVNLPAKKKYKTKVIFKL